MGGWKSKPEPTPAPESEPEPSIWTKNGNTWTTWVKKVSPDEIQIVISETKLDEKEQQLFDKGRYEVRNKEASLLSNTTVKFYTSYGRIYEIISGDGVNVLIVEWNGNDIKAHWKGDVAKLLRKFTITASTIAAVLKIVQLIADLFISVTSEKGA